MSQATSLRERNKERTRIALSDAALALLAEGSIEAVTADAIATRAGVSRRTFFNYFNRVEDVVTETCRRATHRSLERFLARPATEPLIDSVRAVLADLVTDPVLEELVPLHRAADASPAVRAFLLEYQEEQADAFEAALHARYGADVDPVWAAALSGPLAAAVTRVARLRDPEAGRTDAEAAIHTLHTVSQAIGWLFSGFDTQSPRKA